DRGHERFKRGSVMGRKTCITSRAFLVIWTLFAFEVSVNYAEICEKIDDCSCKKSNGKIINLRKIDGASKPAFENIKDSDPDQNYVYSWNPCTKFTRDGDGCKDVFACQETPGTTDNKYPLAKTVEKFEVTDGITYITYESIEYGGHTRSFQIALKCDENKFPGGLASVTEHSVSATSGYSTTFTSCFACDDGCPNESGQTSSGLSTGSILLIV
ncbi:hypothetical protein ACROYT_G024742, partial [Oculina patagonica]